MPAQRARSEPKTGITAASIAAAHALQSIPFVTVILLLSRCGCEGPETERFGNGLITFAKLMPTENAILPSPHTLEGQQYRQMILNCRQSHSCPARWSSRRGPLLARAPLRTVYGLQCQAIWILFFSLLS